MMALIIGLIVTVVSIWAGLRYLDQVILVLKGSLPLMFLCGGILAIIAGATAIRDESEAKKLEQEQKPEEKK
ncbi:MAG: hypothetical protein AB1633_01640 [Elusimicrobiota bacterium]